MLITHELPPDEAARAEQLVAADNRRNTIDLIIAFEQGELDEDGILELFQHLVDTGDAWRLQGSYGRTAEALLDAGLIVAVSS